MTQNNDIVQNKQEKTLAKEKSTFLDSVTCNVTGLKLNYHPIVVFSDEVYCYYLKCYPIKHQDGSLREQLFGDVEISTIKTINKKPFFLKHNNYVDTACLYWMKKKEFEFVCKYRKIPYTQFNCDGICVNDRIAVLKQLIKNLQTKEIELIICSFNVRFITGKIFAKTAFNIQYCHKKVWEKEKSFFESSSFPYQFVNEEKKDAYRKLLEIKLDEINALNMNFFKKNPNNRISDTFTEYAYFFAHILNEELQKSS